jgi:hypothetical protein
MWESGITRPYSAPKRRWREAASEWGQMDQYSAASSVIEMIKAEFAKARKRGVGVDTTPPQVKLNRGADWIPCLVSREASG